MSDLKHLFVPYELAVKLKEKGFNEDCFGYYSGDNPYGELPNKLNIIKCKQQESIDDLAGRCLAPIYQQVVDWFREKHNLHIYPIRDGGWWLFRGADVSDEENKSPESNIEPLSSGGGELSDYYKQYQKAIEEALKLI